MPLHPISPTLVKLGPDKWEFTSDARARRFSFREAAHLQGFGDLVFSGNRTCIDEYEVYSGRKCCTASTFEAVAKALPQELWFG